MVDETNEVLISGWLDEWYQKVFMCAECGCRFMTYIRNTSPHNYCPNCGIKFLREVTGNG